MYFIYFVTCIAIYTFFSNVLHVYVATSNINNALSMHAMSENYCIIVQSTRRIMTYASGYDNKKLILNELEVISKYISTEDNLYKYLYVLC